MGSSLGVSRRVLVAGALGLAAIACVFTVPNSLGPRLEEGFDALRQGEPYGLWLGCALFIASLLCSAGAWRTGIGECGGRVGWFRAAASYGAGSFANSLLPARVGDGVRIALFSRAIEGRNAAWTSSGVFILLGATRSLALVGLVAAAAALGAVPVWTVFILVGLGAAAAVVATAVRKTEARSRLSHLLDAFRAFGRSPRASLAVIGWGVGSTAARLLAATAIAAALGVPSPLLAALVIVPALELAGLLPLTPGNVGITSGAVAVALRARGIDLSSAMTIGIAFHAVEMAAGLGFGSASVLYLTGARSVTARRVATALAASGALAVAAAFAAMFVI